MTARLASAPARMTAARAAALIRELDALRPRELDALTVFERATYRRAIDLANLPPRHAQALRLALT